MSGLADADIGKRRLHPLSPLLRGLKSLWVVIAALSWQGFAQFGVSTGSIIVGGGGVLGLVWAWVTWRFTGFELRGRELRVSEGVLMRRHRTIPLERLQSVEVVQPLLARVVGLAELRLEVVGASKAEAPLSYLSITDARGLRSRLLEASQHVDVNSPALSTSEEPAGEAAELTVPSDRLLYSQLLTPEVFLLPFAVALVIANFVWQPDASFYGIAGLITATVGILVKPVRSAMVNYDFQLSDTERGLRIQRGLTERRTQTLPVERVTAVVVQWPLLWRGARWARVRVVNAGQGAQEANAPASGVLLPVGTTSQVRHASSLALAGVDVMDAALSPVPRRARWIAPVSASILGARLDESVFVSRRGRFTRTLVTVPYARIQSVRVVQGRLQRLLRLATVNVDIAGGVLVTPRAMHYDVSTALNIAEELRRRARTTQ